MNEPEPPNPRPLEYRTPTRQPRRGPKSGQVFLGFFSWVIAVPLAWFTAIMLRRTGLSDRAVSLLAVGVPLLLLATLSLWLRVRFQWRGFIPGVLLGFGLTCLLPIGIAAVVCGGWK